MKSCITRRCCRCLPQSSTQFHVFRVEAVDFFHKDPSLLYSNGRRLRGWFWRRLSERSRLGGLGNRFRRDLNERSRLERWRYPWVRRRSEDWLRGVMTIGGACIGVWMVLVVADRRTIWVGVRHRVKVAEGLGVTLSGARVLRLTGWVEAKGLGWQVVDG